MFAIEEKIDEIYRETEESVQVIVEGSDEYLDIILSIAKILNNASYNLEEFNDYLYGSINALMDELTDEQIQNNVLPKLKLLNKICMTLVGAIRTSFLYRDVRASLRNYTSQHDILREIIHDIQHLRLAKDDEFNNILKELNDI